MRSGLSFLAGMVLGVIISSCFFVSGTLQREVLYIDSQFSKWANADSFEKQIEALILCDPIGDAKLALARGDRRWIAVLGARPIILPWGKEDKNAKVIAFTGDVQRTEESILLNQLASRYASKYNTFLASLDEQERETGSVWNGTGLRPMVGGNGNEPTSQPIARDVPAYLE